MKKRVKTDNEKKGTRKSMHTTTKPKLKPEFIKKIINIRKGRFMKIQSLSELLE